MGASSLSGQPYSLQRGLITSGGITHATTGSYTISGSIGQIAASSMGDRCFSAHSGLLAGLLPPTLPIPDGMAGDLEVTVTESPVPLVLGGQLTYRIEVENHGSISLTMVTVSNVLPGGVEFVSAASPQTICTGTQTVICVFTNLIPGGCASATIVVTPLAANLLTITTTAAAREPDPQPYNNEAAQASYVSSGPVDSYNWSGQANDQWNNPTNWWEREVPMAGASVTITQGWVNLDGSVILGSLQLTNAVLFGNGDITLVGGARWEGGNLIGPGALRILAGAALNLEGAGFRDLDRPVFNAGSIIWPGPGTFRISNRAPINNLRGGVFLMLDDAPLLRYNGAAINNHGTIIKAGGDGPKVLDLHGGGLTNVGLIQVQNGSIEVLGPVVHQGMITVNSGGSWIIRDSTQHFTSAGRVNGWLDINGGTAMIDSPAQLGKIRLSAGVIDGPANLTLNQIMDWTGGRMDGTGSLLVSTGALLHLSGNQPRYLSRTVNNSGTIRWDGTGILRADNSPTLNNLSGGLFDLQTDATLVRYNTGLILHNQGTVRKSGGLGVQIFDLFRGHLTNSGIIEVQVGTLSLEGRVSQNGTAMISSNAALRFGASSLSTNSGLFNIASNGFVYFQDGSHTLNSGVRFQGAGTGSINGGMIYAEGTVTAENLLLSSGKLSGSGQFTVARSLNWTGGSMEGTGSTMIPAGAKLILDGAGFKDLYRTLNNAGVIEWRGSGSLRGVNRPILNNLPGGFFEIQTDAPLARFNTGAVINNQGVIRKSGGTGIQNFDLLGGGLTNSGVLELETGVLSLNVDYAPLPGSTLSLVLGGTNVGTQFSQLRVGGAMNFNGTLNLRLANGFLPNVGERLQIITYSSRSGVFGSVIGNHLGGGRQLAPDYQPTSLFLVTRMAAFLDPALLRMSGGEFLIRLIGENGKTYVLQASTNFITWRSIRTNTLSGTSLELSDPNPILPLQFYRVIEQP